MLVDSRLEGSSSVDLSVCLSVYRAGTVSCPRIVLQLVGSGGGDPP